jgi:hypothetical protein
MLVAHTVVTAEQMPLVIRVATVVVVAVVQVAVVEAVEPQQ